MTVVPVERRGAVVGEQRCKECCIVGEGGWQERYDGIVGYRKALGEKERSWMRMTFRNTRRAARKHKGLHHAIFGKDREKRQLENTKVRTTQFSPLLEVSSLFVLLEYGLGML